MLTHVPPARLFDETLKMFLSGFGLKSLQLLQRYHLLEPLFAPVAALLRRKPESPEARLLQAGLEGTDERVAADKPVTPTFLFAILFYGPVIERATAASGQWAAGGARRCSTRARRRCASSRRGSRSHAVLRCRCARCSHCSRAFGVAKARRHCAPAPPALSRGIRSAAAACQVGAEDAEIAQWWTDMQSATSAEREAMVTPASGVNSRGGRAATASSPASTQKLDVSVSLADELDAGLRRAGQQPRRARAYRSRLPRTAGSDSAHATRHATRASTRVSRWGPRTNRNSSMRPRAC